MTTTKQFTDNERKLLDAIYIKVVEVSNTHVYDQSEAGVFGEERGQSCVYLNYRDGAPVIKTMLDAYDADYELPEGQTYKPSCLIGQGILNSELSNFNSLFHHEGQSALMPLGEIADIGHDVITACTHIQNVQDGGGTWHHAFNRGLLHLAVEGYPVTAYYID